jgi:flagellar biosynthesis chaperone FliJ
MFRDLLVFTIMTNVAAHISCADQSKAQQRLDVLEKRAAQQINQLNQLNQQIDPKRAHIAFRHNQTVSAPSFLDLPLALIQISASN